MKPVKKATFVLSKEERDPFAHFRPAPWKRPFYAAEDAFESLLATSQSIVDKAEAFTSRSNVTPLAVSYAVLAVLLLAFVYLFVSLKLTLF